MYEKKSPIGFFDSGLGGLSILKKTIELLPGEDYIFYADNLNAPYGPKDVEELKKLSFNIMDYFIKRNVKAVVVACNTATSAAIEDIREKYKDLIIIGTEPALKPAATQHESGDIIVMATERTLKEKKFANLMEKVAHERSVIKLPCPGLVELIDSGKKDSDEVYSFLLDKLKDINKDTVSAVVLGCTHYPFISHHLERILPKANLYDGALGVAKNLKKHLIEKDLINHNPILGKVELTNSLNLDEFEVLAKKLLSHK